MNTIRHHNESMTERRWSLPWGRLLDELHQFYHVSRGRVPVLRSRKQSPFDVLVSTVLSARSRDEVTERAACALLAAYPTAHDLARAPEVRVRPLIRDVGFTSKKARGLIAAAKFLVSEFRGKVPSREEDLLRIPQVGPKTAHAILVFGFRKPGIPVDTHILRVSKRLGVVSPKATILQAQRELARAVPKRFWHLLNPVLVEHGMNTCSAKAPRCGECPIEQWCKKVGVPKRLNRAPKG